MPADIDVILRDQEVVKALAGLITAVLLALTGLLTLVYRKLTKTNEQVTNNHGTNLRDDLDEVRDLIHDGFRRMDHKFGEVHDCQQSEARERQSLDDRIQAEHARIWKAIDERTH